MKARWLAATGVVVLLGACFKDWDRVDPSKGTPPGTGGTAPGGAGGEGGEEEGGQGGVGGDSLCSPGEEIPCYSGPSGTENVGICAGGVTTCNDNGDAFGPCVGETVPATESCENTLDDDCDGSVNEVDAGCMCTPGVISDCYEGPANTEGVGVCVSGQKMCEASGDSETVCVGQVVPSLEECLTTEDDDCSGVPNDGCATRAVRFGGASTSDSFGWDLAVNGSDGYVIVGQSDASVIDLGGGGLGEIGENDGIVALYDSAGTNVWSRRVGGTTQDAIYSVAIDTAGDVYIAGMFSEVLSMGQPSGDATTAGGEDVFIAKLRSADGSVVWFRQLGDAADERPASIAVNPAGTVIAVTGWFDGSIDVGNGVETSPDSSSNGFVVVLDGTGAISWGKTFGASGGDQGTSVAIDGTDIIVGGFFNEEVSFGGTPVMDIDDVDGFVAKLDSGGGETWIARAGGDDYEEVTHIAVDSGGNILAHGEFAGNIDFGGGPTTAVDDDVFVVKYTPLGAVTWEQVFHGVADQHRGALAVDGNDNVWFAVSHEATADYGGGAVHSVGSDDYVVVKLDSSGAHLRTRRYGNGSDNDPRALAALSSNDMLFLGEAESSLDVGLGSMSGTSAESIVLMVLPQ